ncbi:MAG: alpha/beta hydrolase [Oscillospiraceae bacterium]
MTISVNGVTLYYERNGSGDPLIMMHGNGETHDIFDNAVSLLSENFTVYTVDTRGHGHSSAVAQYHYADMAKDMHCFIEALGLITPVFYGFSDGGIVGLLLASQYPKLLSQLIVSGANLRPNGVRAGILRKTRANYRETADPKLKVMLEEPVITADMLRNISVPTTVLAGGFDVIKLRHTREIASEIEHSTLRILPLHGHGSYIVHSKKIAKLILQSVK